MSNKEIRTLSADVIFRRADGQEGVLGTVEGYAAVFDDTYTTHFFGRTVTEKIDRHAFDNADMSDVRALFNHDPNFVLGRTKSNTLQLEVDDRGLKYALQLPDTQAGRDVAVMLQRGDVSQSSFAFTVDEWQTTEDNEGNVEQVIKRIGKLYDVSIVTYPAYEKTEASLRDLENALKQRLQQDDTDIYKRKLTILKLKTTKK